MPGNPVAMPKLTNCAPAPNIWSGTETEKAQDKDPGKAANAALSAAMTPSKKFTLAFVSQDCITPGCTWKDYGPPTYTPTPITITPNAPPDAAHKNLKGPFWEASSTVNWSATVYCYGTKKARDDAKDAREAAEKKAKEQEEKKKE
jgi:hypothetical protein